MTFLVKILHGAANIEEVDAVELFIVQLNRFLFPLIARPSTTVNLRLKNALHFPCWRSPQT